MIQTAIYARVSSERQKEERTIDSQLAALREACKRDNVSIVKEYIDDGWSGETLARPGLDALRDDSGKGLWTNLYIHCPDRLGRDHIDQGIVLRELKKQGIQVIFRDAPLTEENKFKNDIESLVAEYENRQRSERTRRGRLHRAKEGRIVQSVAPFGYKFEKLEKGKQIVVDSEEAKVVKLIFNLYLKLQSTTSVAKELFKLGTKRRAKGVWLSDKISKLLSNDVYTGVWHYGKHENVEPKNRRNKFYKHTKTSLKLKNDWIKFSIPEIIDAATFEQVQELRKKNYRLYGNTKFSYMLGGLVRCSCGRRMFGASYISKHNKKYSYYFCENDNNRIKTDVLDSYVWDKIRAATRNPKVLTQYISMFNKDKDGESLKGLKTDFTAKLKRAENKIKELWELWEEDKINKEMLTNRIGDYTQASKELQKNIKDIDIRLNQTNKKGIIFNSLREFSRLTQIQMNTLNPDKKKEFLKAILREITYNARTGIVDITGNIPILGVKEEMINYLQPLVQYQEKEPLKIEGADYNK